MSHNPNPEPLSVLRLKADAGDYDAAVRCVELSDQHAETYLALSGAADNPKDILRYMELCVASSLFSSRYLDKIRDMGRGDA